MGDRIFRLGLAIYLGGLTIAAAVMWFLALRRPLGAPAAAFTAALAAPVICLLVNIPTFFLIRALRPDRTQRFSFRRLDRCWACGYDLRGLPAAQRCPECGESIAQIPPGPLRSKP